MDTVLNYNKSVGVYTMFGNKKSVNNICQMETVIGKDTIFKGNISSKGTIRIDGQLEGDISTTGNLIVGESAVITAQVTAVNATISGTVYGNVDVSEKLELLQTARMYGNIKISVLTISEGAILKGSCEMRRGVEQPIVEGNLACANP